MSMIDIEQLTIKEARALVALFGGEQRAESAHPLIGKRVIVRADSGVFFGTLVARRQTPALPESDLTHSRHIYTWTSNGLQRLALNAADLAILGAGKDTKITGVVEGLSTIVGTRAIYEATADAIRAIEALPCRG